MPDGKPKTSASAAKPTKATKAKKPAAVREVGEGEAEEEEAPAGPKQDPRRVAERRDFLAAVV